MRDLPSRRLVLRLLAGAAAFPPGAARPQDAPRDGTLGEGDRGIGGTGVIGTIRRFGSIVVNDLRIAYPADVEVRIDGDPAKASDLKIGQVVHVIARPEAGGLATRRIDVTSEVAGPVEAVAPGRITVLGQTVATAGLPGEWRPGARVAVSGLRRPDGVIVASLIEPRETGPARVAGPVRRGGDGLLRIGDLRLEGATALPPGRRALVTGEASGGVLRVTNAGRTGLAFPPGLTRVSIEAYVGRAGRRLDLGSGLSVAGHAGASVPRRGSVRAVVTAGLAPDGGLTVERLRIEGRIAPEMPRTEAPRFDRARDRLDLRGLPDALPGRIGAEPGGRFGGGGEPRGPAIDTRPGSGDIPGAGRPGGPGGFPRPGGGPGGFPGGPGGAGPGGAGPGGLGGPGGPGGRR